MVLQSAVRHLPRETLPTVLSQLVQETAALTQREVQDHVNALKTQVAVQRRATASENERRAMEALRKLKLIDFIEAETGPVRLAVQGVLLRAVELLGPRDARALLE
jgi:hypothetical protein